MTDDDVRAIVWKRFHRGSYREWCRKNGINSAHLSEFMTGKRGPGADLLAALNLEYRIVRRRTKALAALNAELDKPLPRIVLHDETVAVVPVSPLTKPVRKSCAEHGKPEFLQQDQG